VVVIEDLISTGKSSLEAVKAIQEAQGEVVGLCSVFTYEFSISQQIFAAENIKTISLSNYSSLIDIALEKKIISEGEVTLLKLWRENPSEWGK
jgi:orotate phosphoribosyltransferase